MASLREKFGQRIKGIRLSRKMSQEEFSELSFRGEEIPRVSPAHLDLLSVHKAARAISDIQEGLECLGEIGHQ